MFKLIVGVFLLIGLSACSEKPTPEFLKTPEGQLAAIDAKSLNISEYTIQQYAMRLDLIENKCEEPRSRLSDFSVVGVQQIKERTGLEITNLRFLEMMDESIPKEYSQSKLKCAEIASALVVLTK